MHASLIAIFEELGIAEAALLARGALACDEARRLEVAECGADGREHLLVEPAAAAWRALKAATHEDGISLFIVSAFRSIERQAQIIRRKLRAGAGLDDILEVCAAPGFSEHHSGRAVDVSTPGTPVLTVDFAQTPAFAWLTLQAPNFGFQLSYPQGNAQGFRYEPWHWCFDENRPGDETDANNERKPHA